MALEWISSSDNGRAAARNTGSPAWTIGRSTAIFLQEGEWGDKNNCRRQAPFRYRTGPTLRGLDFVDATHRLDLVVENRLVLELKAVAELLPVHLAQLVTYLRITEFETGLLVNLNVPFLKQG